MERRKKGTGQITYVDDPKRKSRWRATITDDKGKQHNRFFKTEKESKTFLREVNSNDNKRKELMESGVTFNAFSEVFLQEKHKENMKPTAYRALKSSVERVCEYLGKMMLRDIDNDVVQQMIFDLAQRGYSESVMDKSRIAVNSVLKMAASKHFLEKLPVFTITVPRQQKNNDDKKAKNNWMRDDEIAAYEAECRRTYVPKRYTKHEGETLMCHPAGYKLLFLLHTGLRVGEALALTWPDYDERSKTILVEKNMVYLEGEKITQTPKTESGERVIILNKQALNDLNHLKQQFDEQTADIEDRRATAIRDAELTLKGADLKAAKAKIKDEYDGYLHNHRYICGATTFPYGSSLQGSTNETHKKICEDIRLNHKVTVHGLRHSYVTHYYLRHKNDPDFDLATFSKSIGHSSIRTTMEIYAHLDMTENRYIQRDVADLKDF